MKNFLKLVLANLTAIFIAATGLVMFFIAFIILASISGTEDIKSNSILTLDLKTKIIDSPTDEQEDIFAFKENNNSVMLYDVLRSIENAKTDEKIKGISLESDNISAGITQLKDIREALIDFKKSGKFVYAYGNGVSQSSYYLNSVADKFYLHPMGGVMLKGLSAEVTFFKNFADKYGIGIEVIRHGKFKAAVEPYFRNEISPENKEQLSVLLNDIWNTTSSEIAKSRKISPDNFKVITDSLYGVLPDLSLKNNLVDKLIQKSDYDNILRKAVGVNTDKKLNKISFYNYSQSLEEETDKDKVAILYASGQIFDGKGYNGIYSETLIKEIKKLQKNDDVKSVVLRINSPGGSANASDCILYELQNLKSKKPLIVSFGDYAASGGYYIAMAADKIYSEPNTLTGSIGVFGVIPYFKELAEKNGIRSDVVSTNSNSNMISTINGLTPGTLNILTKNVEATYQRFVGFVTKNRKKTFEEVDAIGGGRVWSGTRAKQIGLVDELGSLQDAINFAAKSAKLKNYSIESYPKKVSKIEQLLNSETEDDLSTRLIKSKLGKENYKIFEQISNPSLKSSVMMDMPYSVKID